MRVSTFIYQLSDVARKQIYVNAISRYSSSADNHPWFLDPLEKINQSMKNVHYIAKVSYFLHYPYL